MNAYQFIASLMSSLAWPVSVFLIALLFRKRIIEILPRLRLRYGEFDVSMHRLADAEKEAAKATSPALEDAPKPTPEEKEKFNRIAEISPRGAILELRNELEDRVVKFAQARGAKLSPLHTSTTYVVRVLRQMGLIDEVTSAMIDDLRVVGNAAAHDNGRSFTESEAQRFKTIYEVVGARLRAIEAGQIKP